MTFNPRLAVTLFFLVHGAMFGNWAARIPDIKDKFDLTDGQLGLVLLGLPVGVLTGLPLVSGFISRFGSRNMTFWSALAFCAIVPVLSIASSAIILAGVLVVFGWIMSTNDVSMNAQAVAVEQRKGRSIMSSFHAAFSIGGVVGALMGEFLTSVGFSLQQHLLSAALLFVVVAVVSVRSLVDVEGEKQASGGSVFTLPHRMLLPLGAVAFCSSMGEGAMGDWTGIYMADVVNVADEVDGLGFASFSLLMTVGRVTGDYLIDRFQTRALVIASGVLSASGLMLAVLIPELITAVIGFAMVGAGLSYVIPLMFAIAGKMPGLPPGAGIAGTATLGYSGFLAGPPVIGLIADVSSLRIAFVFLAIMVSMLILLSGSVRVHSGRVVQQAAST